MVGDPRVDVQSVKASIPASDVSLGDLRALSARSALRAGPIVQVFNVMELVKSGALQIEHEKLIPDRDFAAEVLEDMLNGEIMVLRYPEDPRAHPAGSPADIRASFLQSKLVSLQMQLASAFSEELGGRQLPASTHSLEIRSALRLGLEMSGDKVPGITSHCAKTLPMHCDLTEYAGLLEPARVSMISWGARRGFGHRAFVNFTRISDVSYDDLVRKRLLKSAPPLDILEPRLMEALASQGTTTTVEILDNSITLFGNRGLAHGTTWEAYCSGLSENRRIDTESRSKTGESATLIHPIHVVFL